LIRSKNKFKTTTFSLINSKKGTFCKIFYENMQILVKKLGHIFMRFFIKFDYKFLRRIFDTNMPDSRMQLGTIDSLWTTFVIKTLKPLELLGSRNIFETPTLDDHG